MNDADGGIADFGCSLFWLTIQDMQCGYPVFSTTKKKENYV
jgi:hypothetical protein